MQKVGDTVSVVVADTVSVVVADTVTVVVADASILVSVAHAVVEEKLSTSITSVESSHITSSVVAVVDMTISEGDGTSNVD